MKLDLNVEKLIDDVAYYIEKNAGEDNIMHCNDCIDRNGRILNLLRVRKLDNIFDYLSADDSKELYNELFVKDDRILNAFKSFAEDHHYADVSIECEEDEDIEGNPSLSYYFKLYKSKDTYVNEVVNSFLLCIKHTANDKDISTCYNLHDENGRIEHYLNVEDLYKEYDFDMFNTLLFNDIFIKDDRIMKAFKSFALAHGYVDVSIEEGHYYDDFPKFMLYKIDINKK